MVDGEGIDDAVSSSGSDPGSAREKERGATIVEFVLSAMVIFTFLVGAMEMFAFGYLSLATHFAVNRAMRWAVAQNDEQVLAAERVAPCDYSTYRSPQLPRNERIRQCVIDEARRFNIELPADRVAVCPVRAGLPVTCWNPDGTAVLNSGNPRDNIQIEIHKVFRFAFQSLEFEYVAKSLGKNEPFRTN